jgi:2-(1,2-epoxy-1,2-dihydrophenyl)acetyl-CoA isomerase
VNKVVPRAELEKTAAEWAGRLAAGPTKAIGFAKFLTNRSLDTDRQGSFWDEGYLQEMLVNTADCTEGIASFMERRPAEFKGW